MPTVRLGHYVLGVHGLALLRGWLTGAPGAAERVAELARLAAETESHPLLGFPLEIPGVEVSAGYAAWAETYDRLPNPLVRVEEPVSVTPSAAARHPPTCVVNPGPARRDDDRHPTATSDPCP